jgi:hypothetical protein
MGPACCSSEGKIGNMNVMTRTGTGLKGDEGKLMYKECAIYEHANEIV